MTAVVTGAAKYAVFLPVRNGERYLAAALASVLHQTQRDWRLVVLDNASSDRTAEILTEHGHSALTVLRSPAALSIGESWARIGTAISDLGLQNAYCTIIGHDDILAPGFLSCIDALIESEPGATLYQTAFDLIDANGHLIRPCRPIPGREESEDFIAARCWGLRDSFGTGYVFRGYDYLSVGGIADFPRLLYADDLLFARLARLAHKVCAPSVRCSYRLHRASASSSVSVSLYEAQMAALEHYVATLQVEWSDFVASDRGSAALAGLLAREAMLFAQRPLRSLLPDALRGRVDRLASTFETAAAGVPFTRWLGSNVVSREGYVLSKSIYLSRMFAADRLSRFGRTPASD